jgi:4a-hydroxytetrahydrobiopterin dehydratase
MNPKISDGEDEVRVKADLKALVNNGWSLNEEQMHIEKTYFFKTWTKVIVCQESQLCHLLTV